MAGSKATGGSSGRVQKKAPSKSKASSSSSPSGSGSKLGFQLRPAKGASQLPAARVKRIIKEDKDVQMVSNDAVFLISMATVSFFISNNKNQMDQDDYLLSDQLLLLTLGVVSGEFYSKGL